MNLFDLLKKLAQSLGGAETVDDHKIEVEPAKTHSHTPSASTMVAPVSVLDDNSPMMLEARTRAKELVLEAKDKALRIRDEAEEEARHIKSKALETEKNLAVQKAKLEASEHENESKTRTLRMAKEAIEKKQKEVDEMFDKQKSRLEEVASLSKEEARKLLLEKLDKELSEEKGKRIRLHEEEIKKESDKIAEEILIDALKYGATDVVVEHSTSKVKLPDADIKGRIIGKEGRNIRSFEELTGVDLDLDSSPGEITISSFDPIRREIAKIALEKLMSDGRIQPARIEEIVEKTKKDIELSMFKAGDDLCHKLGVYSLSKELIQIIGRFKYRYSYGQNMIEHTMETARIGIALAHSLKADVETVKLGCLLHDIGKVIFDKEGTHPDLGVALLREHGVDSKVVACVAEHHNDSQSSIESGLVALADHISGARPGSRGEDYEAYVKRMQDLEGAATAFGGVEKAYAVSAGREVRVFVSPEKVDDASTALLAREIARKIELEQTYPGTVKVVVIRETRVTETAK